MLTEWLILAAVVGFGVACLLAVRATCLVALTLLREHLAAQAVQRADEISYLRGQVSRKDTELLGVAHPTVQARMHVQANPEKLKDPSWDAFLPTGVRNPSQFIVRQESGLGPGLPDTVARVPRGTA